MISNHAISALAGALESLGANLAPVAASTVYAAREALLALAIERHELRLEWEREAQILADVAYLRLRTGRPLSEWSEAPGFMRRIRAVEALAETIAANRDARPEISPETEATGTMRAR